MKLNIFIMKMMMTMMMPEHDETRHVDKRREEGGEGEEKEEGEEGEKGETRDRRIREEEEKLRQGQLANEQRERELCV